MSNDSSAHNLSPNPVIRYREQRIFTGDHQHAVARFSSDHIDITEGRIINISRFGARISIPEDAVFVSRGDQIKTLRLYLGDVRIYDGPATVINEIRSTETFVDIGLALFGHGIDIDQVNAVLQIESTIDSHQNFKSVSELSKHIDARFKTLVADLSTLLADLRMKFKDEERRIQESALSPSHKQRLEEHAINVASSLYSNDIQIIFEEFTKVVYQMDSDLIALHKKYFRSNFHAYVLDAPFINRAFHKPLGYAGDFGLMVMLYEYQDIGITLFDKFFHRMGCNAPSAVANKNRVIFLSDLIYQEYAKSSGNNEFLISSIACGPAREVHLFLNHLAEGGIQRPVKTVCLDREPYALDYAQSQIRKSIKPGAPIETVFLKEDAVLGIIKKNRFISEINGSSVISCAGLYDYLSDRLASKMIEGMYALLAPGGTLLVGNVSNETPDRFSMDFLMEWNLVLRGADEMLRLVPEKLSQDPQISVEVVAEPLGLNLFLRIKKPGAK